jgi:isopentenyl-diphosphate Delta-isomerase
MMEDRKNDHLDLAISSQAENLPADKRFSYEPLLGSYSQGVIKPFSFLGRTLKTPIWVSSMTGGATHAKTINLNLAKACNEFGMGMGLGSCRILLEDEKHFPDFDMRDVIGDDLPLYANIGIAQLEEMLLHKSQDRISGLVSRLRADGMIIHVNPIQEWLQAEGDLHTRPPLETIEEFLSLTHLKVIVKEVGQGMGTESISRLMQLPVEAFELAAFGGTNFAKIELARSSPQQKELYEPISMIGHSADEMLEIINKYAASGDKSGCRQIIISGGIHSFLDGYYYMSKSILPSIYGQASGLLRHARGEYEDLRQFVKGQINGLIFARAFLKVKNQL